MIARGVAEVLQKHFYDPQMKGVDWKKALADAESKINATDRVGEMYGAIDEMVLQLDDSHTRFIPPEQTRQPKFGFQLKPFGNATRIYKIQETGPAAQAGLKLGDTIVGIDGVPADRKHYFHTLIYYRFIQPEEVMVVDVLVDGIPKRLTLQAELPTRLAAVEAGDHAYFLDRVREAEILSKETPFQSERYGDVGYVRIPSFETDRAERALWKVKDARALVVDLRGNLGGSTEVLERFAGYFHKDNTEIMKAAFRGKSESVIAKPHTPSFWDVPLVVLVDSESASASEIFARHIQLTGRGMVIGDKTMGAVSVAQYFPQTIGINPFVPYGVETTVARAIFPDNQDLEKVGVTPDKMCIPSAYALAQKKDPCLDMAMTTLKEKLNPPAAAQK
ncbi:MAG TPA: S41 family peptidase [Candidatus Dormibacteraeota bacterium]|nr:S41 family peptidase [Candidatus Dormibacteraeota bacterium]